MLNFDKERDAESLRDFWDFLKTAAIQWREDHAPRLGAALSFYAIFSMAPSLFILITIAGVLYGREPARNQIVQQLSSIVGDQVAIQIGDIIRQTSEQFEGGISTGWVLGFLALLFGATAFFTSLRGALNQIWRVKEANRPDGLWGSVRTRLLALLFVVLIALALVMLIIADSILLNLSEDVAQQLPAFLTGASLEGVRLFVSHVVVRFGFVVFVVAAIYKVLPEPDYKWAEVIGGAMVTAFLLYVGQVAISEYISLSSLTSMYGTAGSLVAVLLWVYYSTLVFFFGAEIVYVYVERHGSDSGTRERGHASAQG